MPHIRTIAVALALSTAALVAAPAQASFLGPCGAATCLLDPEAGDFGFGQFNFDYTVPPDGHRYRWAIDFTSADPLATITLAAPNQTEVFTTIRNGVDFDYGYDGNPAYVFTASIAPGRSTFLVRAPAAFDFCAQPGPDGEVCAAAVQIWGNGTFLTLNSSAPVLATFSESAVPEPAMWTILLVGFGMAGTAMRRTSLRLPRSA